MSWFSLEWFGISRAVAFFKQMSHSLIDRCEIINRRVASRFVLRPMARWMKLIGKTRIRPWMQFSVCQILLEACHSPNVQQNLDTLKKVIATWQQQMAENVQSFTVQEQASGDYIQQRESAGGEQQHRWPRWLMQPVWLVHQEHYTWQCQGPSFPETMIREWRRTSWVSIACIVP